jgi:hypothetical protein
MTLPAEETLRAFLNLGLSPCFIFMKSQQIYCENTALESNTHVPVESYVMSRLVRIIALEGVCCAGKSSLAAKLAPYIQDTQKLRVISFPDYVVMAGGDHKVPLLVPESLEDDIIALEFFLKLENWRLMKAANADVVILDRSAHSLLAHRYALAAVHKCPRALYSQGREILGRSNAVLWPHLIVYVRPSSGLLERHRQLRSFRHTLLASSEYNCSFEAYFLPRLLYNPNGAHLIEFTSERITYDSMQRIADAML